MRLTGGPVTADAIGQVRLADSRTATPARGAHTRPGAPEPLSRHLRGPTFDALLGQAVIMTTLDVNAEPGSVVDDYDAVRAIVQLCLDGEATGDVGKLEQAFHPSAWMFGDLAGTRYDVPIQTLFDMSAESPADTGCYRSRILSITCHGDVATATVVEDGYWGTVSFLDLLSLCRIGGTWKIVNKTFAHLGGDPPA